MEAGAGGVGAVNASVILSREDGEGPRGQWLPGPSPSSPFASLRVRRLRMTLLIFLIAACARTHVDRAEWQRMSKEEKTLYVRTLLGHEKVKEAKGGNDRTFDRPPEEYARRIDDAYARGEQRDTGAVFEELGAKR